MGIFAKAQLQTGQASSGKVVAIGDGHVPLFNRKLTGNEMAMLLNTNVTPEEVTKTIVDTLHGLSISRNTQLTPEQMESAVQEVTRALNDKFGALMKHVNPALGR